MEAIAYIENDFKEKFGIPRQAGRTRLLSRVTFVKKYAVEEAFRGLDEFSHIWLIFEFSKARREEFSPTVRPPRLGGNERVGVFATRSPFRPNSLGLSCVKLIRVEKTANGISLLVEGADLLDGTPIFDVKPYIPYTDCQKNATGSFAEEHSKDALDVTFPEELLTKIPLEKRDGLLDCLKDDPRPSYQDDERVYGMKFGNFNIRFTVQGGVLTVLEVTEN